MEEKKRTRLSFNVTEEVREQLEGLAESTGAESLTEVLRRALNLYDVRAEARPVHRRRGHRTRELHQGDIPLTDQQQPPLDLDEIEDRRQVAIRRVLVRDVRDVRLLLAELRGARERLAILEVQYEFAANLAEVAGQTLTFFPDGTVRIVPSIDPDEDPEFEIEE